jgi:hypothetical protein
MGAGSTPRRCRLAGSFEPGTAHLHPAGDEGSRIAPSATCARDDLKVRTVLSPVLSSE